MLLHIKRDISKVNVLFQVKSIGFHSKNKKLMYFTALFSVLDSCKISEFLYENCNHKIIFLYLSNKQKWPLKINVQIKREFQIFELCMRIAKTSLYFLTFPPGFYIPTVFFNLNSNCTTC